MKKFHLALNVSDIHSTIREYSLKFHMQPEIVIPGQYALWRTETLNISIRNTPEGPPGTLRHLGWENPQAQSFKTSRDCNGIVWEEFTAGQQADEIKATWPEAQYDP